ncbi:hypothetical protein EKO04_003241 [Ascochyta lentis]|uniref:DUF1748-domain-containing protein n=1 Tax=Ascochyta lentis TaxID=205686 RepID=A0A8H7J9I5_9PLEO|nr:hypothetical protein EKO04_003241 [Ascochyta lentis]
MHSSEARPFIRSTRLNASFLHDPSLRSASPYLNLVPEDHGLKLGKPQIGRRALVVSARAVLVYTPATPATTPRFVALHHRNNRSHASKTTRDHLATNPPTSTDHTPSAKPLHRTHRTPTHTQLDNMVLGKVAHYAFDAVLVSAFLAGVRRSTGLTVKPDQFSDTPSVQKWLDNYLWVGETVMDQSVAFFASSSYFERKR